MKEIFGKEDRDLESTSTWISRRLKKNEGLSLTVVNDTTSFIKRVHAF